MKDFARNPNPPLLNAHTISSSFLSSDERYKRHYKNADGSGILDALLSKYKKAQEALANVKYDLVTERPLEVKANSDSAAAYLENNQTLGYALAQQAVRFANSRKSNELKLPVLEKAVKDTFKEYLDAKLAIQATASPAELAAINLKEKELEAKIKADNAPKGMGIGAKIAISVGIVAVLGTIAFLAFRRN